MAAVMPYQHSSTTKPYTNTDGPSVSIVIPAHNEAGRIGHAIQAVLEQWAEAVDAVEVIVVDDGSTDGTVMEATVFAQRQPDRVRVISLSQNRGKGYALRCGFRESRGAVVGFIDADLEYPATALPHMVAAVEPTQRACAVAVRVSDHRRWHERWTSHLARTLARFLLRLPVRDTQAGLKVFPGWFARNVLAHAHEDGWLFDVELLLAATTARLTILEIPVTQERYRPRRATAATMLACAPTLGRLAWQRWNHWARREGAETMQMIRFGLVGLCNTACDLAAFMALSTLWPPDGDGYRAAVEALGAWIVATLVAYPLHARFTFRRRLSRWGFYAVTSMGVALQMAATGLVTQDVPSVPPLLGKALGILLAAGFTYTGYRWLARRASTAAVPVKAVPESPS
ncbi:MAG: bifunctional glycosyltransferase family 2/GtrA family protein [Firmicutes bacterium]|nr:bifunctional glycosyltransferase family 2/GtrA family protein [Bacillota bacterium]